MIFKVNDELTVQFRFKHHNALGVRLTTAVMCDPNSGEPLAHGRALCNPKDNFCKDTGRKIALQKLFKLINNTFDKEVRTRFWKQYLQWTNNKVMKGE